MITLTSGVLAQAKDRADIAILRWYAATPNNFILLLINPRGMAFDDSSPRGSCREFGHSNS
jgi:hypothetical protein